MAEVAPAPAKKATGAVKAARKPAGPSVTELLMQAVTASKERGGISLAALKKSLAASDYDVEKNNSRVKLGLKSLVTKGTLLQTKGTGASGSFKLNKKQADPKDKAAGKKQQQQQPPAGTKTAKKPSDTAAKKAKKAPVAAGSKKPVKKAVKKPASVVAKKPKAKAKSPAKPLKAKAKAKPKAATKVKAAPKKK